MKKFREERAKKQLLTVNSVNPLLFFRSLSFDESALHILHRQAYQLHFFILFEITTNRFKFLLQEFRIISVGITLHFCHQCRFVNIVECDKVYLVHSFPVPIISNQGNTLLLSNLLAKRPHQRWIACLVQFSVMKPQGTNLLPLQGVLQIAIIPRTMPWARSFWAFSPFQPYS